MFVLCRWLDFSFLIEISVINCCAGIFMGHGVCVYVYGSGGVIKSLLSSVRLTSRNIGINYNVEIFILEQF